MTGRGGQVIGRSCRGGCGSRGSGRVISHYTPISNKNKGLFIALGTNIFDYGQKEAAEQTRMTWEKIVHHFGAIYRHDISDKLQNKKSSPSPSLNTL